MIRVLDRVLRSRRPSLPALVAVLMLGILALCFALVVVGTTVLTSNMLAAEWQATSELVRYEVREHGLEAFFTDAAYRRDHAAFATALAPILRLPEVVRVKAWGSDASVIWSDDKRVIGRAHPENAFLQQALRGITTAVVKDLKAPENVFERERFTTLAEIYVPIPARDDPARVIGVLEVYKVPKRLFAAVDDMKRLLWTMAGAGLAVYVVIFFFVCASWRQRLVLERNLKTTLRDLEAKNGELDTFVYTVSHDLKAPLVAIQGMATVVIEDSGPCLDEVGRHYLERIDANAQRMERLIRDLLQLSRIGREACVEEPVDLAAVVDEILAELEPVILTRGVKVATGDLGTVSAVPAHIRQVMANLVSNAVKYLGDTPTPTVEIGSAERDGMLECWVRDNGIGIAPEYQPRIFEMFQRLEDVQVEGTGLGLAIVRKIVLSRGGRVWVESAPGEGATFRFTWPLASPVVRAA